MISAFGITHAEPVSKGVLKDETGIVQMSLRGVKSATRAGKGKLVAVRPAKPLKPEPKHKKPLQVRF